MAPRILEDVKSMELEVEEKAEEAGQVRLTFDSRALPRMVGLWRMKGMRQKQKPRMPKMMWLPMKMIIKLKQLRLQKAMTGLAWRRRRKQNQRRRMLKRRLKRLRLLDLR